jgi:hypothetical protein
MTKQEFLDLCNIYLDKDNKENSAKAEEEICNFTRQIFDKQVEIELEFNYHRLEYEYPNYQIDKGKLEIFNIPVPNEKIIFYYSLEPSRPWAYVPNETIEIYIDSLFLFDEAKFRKATRYVKLLELDQQIYDKELEVDNLKAEKELLIND